MDDGKAWRPALFKGKEVLVLCDPAGAVMLDRGRVPMKYKVGHDRIYHAGEANVTDADGHPLRRSALPAPPEASAAAARARPGSPLPSPVRRRTPKDLPAPPLRELPTDAVRIFTDGACSGNPGGPAALGVVVEDGKAITARGEYLGDAGTNNLAELSAILRGLELAPSTNRTTVIHTDSKYALGVLTGGWKAKVHLGLIARIKERMASFRFLELVYVPGHSGVPGNERADELARRAIQRRGDVDESTRG